MNTRGTHTIHIPSMTRGTLSPYNFNYSNLHTKLLHAYASTVPCRLIADGCLVESLPLGDR